ncbi:hypothetical protein AHiyo4_11000 [Arthrobacter sp. Hiyo4]|nr:hypothetical protein AHiyo4_11000 [Arthrobacter sp. Hiyo4]
MAVKRREMANLGAAEVLRLQLNYSGRTVGVVAQSAATAASVAKGSSVAATASVAG